MKKVLAACSTGLLMFHSSAYGVWDFRPDATLESGYDDNVRLRDDDDLRGEEDGVITSLEAQGRLRNLTETSDVSLILGGRFTNYSSIDLDDEHAEFLLVRARTQGERHMVGIDGRLQRDELLRNTQFDPDFVDGPGVGPDPGDDLDGDIDVGVEEQISRTSAFVRPYYQYRLTERTSANVSVDFRTTSYGDEAEEFGLRESDRYGAALNLTHALSPSDAVGINLRASRFEPDDDDEADTYEVTAGWDHQFTERSSISFEVGGRQVDREGDTDTGVVFRLATERETERGELFGFVERSVRPNGFGNVVEADRVGLGWEHALAERFEFLLNLNAVRTEDSNQGLNSRDREYFEIRPGFEWLLAESWSLGAHYRFRWIDRESNDSEATSNAAFVSLTYHPPVPHY